MLITPCIQHALPSSLLPVTSVTPARDKSSVHEVSGNCFLLVRRGKKQIMNSWTSYRCSTTIVASMLILPIDTTTDQVALFKTSNPVAPFAVLRV